MAGPSNEAEKRSKVERGMKGAGDNSFDIDQTAFLHNRSLQVKKGPPYIVGCHDLDCILQALAKGLVVAAVSRFPGDGLPKGVYELWLSLRKEYPIPNPQYHSRRPRSCEHHPSQIEQTEKTKAKRKWKEKGKGFDDIPTGPCICYTTFQWFEFSELPETKEGENPKYIEVPTRIPPTEKEIKLRYAPVIKTAFSAEVWSDEKLRKKCTEAFRNFLKGMKKASKVRKDQEKTCDIYWCGKFYDDNDYNHEKAYWIEGYYDVVSNPTGQKMTVKQFNFVHKEGRRNEDEDEN